MIQLLLMLHCLTLIGKILLSFFFYGVLHNISATGSLPEGVCGIHRGDIICCPHFTLEEGSCVPCPLGRFGKYCGEFCPPGYFGYRCREQCDCEVLNCNPEFGCKTEGTTFSSELTTLRTSQTKVTYITVQKTGLSYPTHLVTSSSDRAKKQISTERTTSSAKPNSQSSSFPWQWIIPFAIGFFLLCCVIICLVLKERLNRRQRRGWNVLTRRSFRFYRNMNIQNETDVRAEVDNNQGENNRSIKEENGSDTSSESYVEPVSSARPRNSKSGDPDKGYSTIVDVEVNQSAASYQDREYIQIIEEEKAIGNTQDELSESFEKTKENTNEEKSEFENSSDSENSNPRTSETDKQ